VSTIFKTLSHQQSKHQIFNHSEFHKIIFHTEISVSGILLNFCLKINSKKSSQFQKFKKLSQV